MEQLVGPNLEVALSLNEGYDFGFVNSNFLIIASFDKNELETTEFRSEQVVKFESEFIWLSNKNNIRTMRNYKIPIRLDFYKINEQKQRTFFGYVIISLKSAQYISKMEYVALKEETYKVCGLKKESKGSCPQITLSLRIQDEQNDDIPSVKHDQTTDIHGKASSIALEIPSKEVQLLAGKEINRPCHEVVVATPDTPEGDRNIDQVQGILEPYHSFQLDIQLKSIKWENSLKDVHLRFHHARSKVTYSAHPVLNETVPGTVMKAEDISAQLALLASPAEVGTLLTTVPPVLTICTNRQGRPQVLGKALLSAPSVSNVEVEDSAVLMSIVSSENLGVVSYTARLSDLGSQTCQQLALLDDNILADQVQDELEAWKIKEMQRLEANTNKRLKEEIIRLEAKWAAREQQLESEASEQMDICRTLGQELQEVIRQVTKKEKDLEETKVELEARYRALITESQKEVVVERVELLESIRKKDDTITKLREDLEKLKSQMRTTKKVKCLTEDQTKSLLCEMKTLQEKLENANHTKEFFKEQWGRAVRELHRIKSEGWKNTNRQLQLRKEELRQLALDQLTEIDNKY